MRRVARWLLACAFACVALVGGSWSGDAFAGAAAAASPVRQRPAYGGAIPGGEIPIGDALEVNGQPMQLSIFYTADPPTDVIRFYALAFQARGVLPVLSGGPGLAAVSVLDPKTGLQHFVSAIPQPGAQTLVLVGVTNPRRPPRFTRGAQEAGFPVPIENRAFLGYRAADAATESETAQFISSLPPADVLAFYRSALAAQGWEERGGESTPALAVFGREGAALSVAVQALGPEAGAAVFVNRTSGRLP